MLLFQHYKTLWQHSPSWFRELVITVLSWRIGPHDPQAPEQPLYVLGAFASSSGLAEGARLYAQARRREGNKVICLDITHAMQQRADFPQGLEDAIAFDERQQLTRPGTVIIHANPPQFQLALLRLGKDFLHNKRILGYWAWEVETLPSIWVQALRLLDGVEVPSRFVQNAIKRHTARPVRVVPHEIISPSLRKTTFMEDGILRCLYSFDVSSGLNRKNPEAALRAFAEAFPQGGAELTFKVSGATAAPAAMEALRERCRSVPHVHIITDILDRDALSRLYCRHDVYLSLHRSEGYGLTIREAMLHGLHVVATGWSGNMDFMDGELSHPVPFTLVPLKEKQGPLKGLKGQWAEADTAAAAAILRKLREQLSTSPC